jgi:hypothetical protein
MLVNKEANCRKNFSPEIEVRKMDTCSRRFLRKLRRAVLSSICMNLSAISSNEVRVLAKYIALSMKLPWGRFDESLSDVSYRQYLIG